MVNSDLLEYLNLKKINWFPINLDVKQSKTGKYKKILKPYNEDNEMPTYNELNNTNLVKKRQQRIDKYEYIWIDTRFINQIDVDGDYDPNIETPYFNSVTKGKRHYFVKGFHGINKKRANTKWKDVELLAGQGSYASKNISVFNTEIEIKNYSGIVETVLHKEDSTTPKKSQKTINLNISNYLNEIFTTSGDWRSNSYESAKCVAVFPASDKTCLVNPSKRHSCVQSYISLGKASCTAKCYSCGDKKIDIKKNNINWKQIKNYFELSTASGDVDYDAIQDYVDEYCAEEDLMKKDGYMMKRSSDCKIEYERVGKYAEFLDNLFRDADAPLKKAYKKPAAKRNLENYLTEIHTDIRILKRDSNIIAFKNGYLRLNDLTYHDYDDDKKYLFVSKKYIPFDFDTDWLTCNWNDIDCPIFDKIVNDQPDINNSDDVRVCFYGLLGSLHYPVGSDNIKVAPYLFGASGTGKSTIVSIILNTFSPEIVGTINYKEKTFGKSAFLDHDVIIDQDTPSTMVDQFGKTDFQKAVSGETIAIPIKNQKQEEQHKVTQRMLFCSQYTQDVQDTGEVIRRIAYFQFRPVESKLCSNLEESCIKTELHKVLIKILLARKELLNKYKSKPFHDWNIPYFDSRIEDVLMDNNYIFRMISQSKNFRIRKGHRYPFEDFVIQFNEHYRGQPNRPKKPKVTDVMFSKMGLNIEKETVCKDCGKPFTQTKCCEKHSKNNKTTKYYISDLYYQENKFYSHSQEDSSDEDI
tara:strand:+ start:15674 stop:17923 length:2250 start_codon:yes stop_codon:yes gene_type:complete